MVDIFRQGIATGDATFETEAPSWEEWDRSRTPECRLVAEAVGGELVDGPFLDGGVVGFAALSPTSSRCVYGGVCEVMVYVADGWRGRGVGRLLLDALAKASERAGIWTLLAGVFPENVASIRLHERVGFRVVGHHERIGRMADGRWRDTVLLERRSSRAGCD